jgi:3-oxoacyl-[acyl-carrier protein] reductase
LSSTLSDRVALVTASSRGIGLGVARSLHEAGARVSISARDEQSIGEAAESLGGVSDRLLAGTADVSDPVALRRLVEATVEGFGGQIDILVNNSGGPPTGVTTELNEDQWAGAIDNNLMSVIRLSVLVAPGMKEQRWGRIVNLTSTTAKEPDSGMALSSVTRAGVAAYSKTLARELGPFGITVNTVLTGGVMTERMESLIRSEIEGTGERLEDAIARTAETFPVRYIPRPEEFGQVVRFLVSDEAAFLNGVALPLDGGFTRSSF